MSKNSLNLSGKKNAPDKPGAERSNSISWKELVQVVECHPIVCIEGAIDSIANAG